MKSEEEAVVTEEEEVEDKRIRSFWWPIKLEDIETTEEGKEAVTLKFPTSRWVASTQGTAIRWLLKHPNAQGLREYEGTYAVVKCILSRWEDREFEGEPEPMPEDWFQGPLVDDQMNEKNTPTETIEGYDGYLLPKGFNHTMLIGRVTFESLISLHPKKVKSIEVSVLSPEEVLAISAVEIFEDAVYQSGDIPIEHGTMDQRMGSVSPTEDCYTCGNAYDSRNSTGCCPGHFGHIVLATPVPNFLFLQGNTYFAPDDGPLSFTVNAVCHHCNELRLSDTALESISRRIDLIQEDNANEYGLQEIRNLTKSMLKKLLSNEDKKNGIYPCPRCEEVSPYLKFQHSAQLWMVTKTPRAIYSGARNIQMNAIYSLLENIPSKYNKYLGFFGKSKPSDMYWSVLPVAPICTRPTEFSDDSEPELNDLTLLYQQIITINNKIISRKQSNADASLISTFERELSKACVQLATGGNAAIGAGGVRSIRDKRGRTKNVAYKGVLDRLTGGKRKTRMRSVIQSKVVNQLSYSVVTPNPKLNIDEVGVPFYICATCTIDEEVTQDNIVELQEMVVTGMPNGGYNISSKDYEPFAHSITLGGFRKGDVGNLGKFQRSCEDMKWGDQPLDEAWSQHKYDNEINLSGVEIEKINDMRKEFAYTWNRTNRSVWREIKVGDIVTRSLVKGDVGLFNRAPSLHRQNVLGMKVIPMSQKSLSFNPTICIPFNADYDGDAMKMHFVQSPEAIQQTKDKLMLGKNIIHARYGKLTIATDQDQTSGLALLTMPIASKKGQYKNGLGYTKEEGIPFFDKNRAMNLISAAWYKAPDGTIEYATELPTPDHEHNGKQYWTGRAMVSIYLPDFMNATFKGNNPLRDEEGVIVRTPTDKQIYNGEFVEKEEKELVNIRDGVLLTGTLDKNSFGEGGASIAPSFFYHYGYDKGHEELTKFIGHFTRLAFEAHNQVGYTIGTEDCTLASKNVRGVLKEQYEMVSVQIMKIQKAYDNRTLHELPDLTPADYSLILSEPLDWAEDKMKDLAAEYEKYIIDVVSDASGPDNPIQIAVRSKARGSATNIQQMSASYGQTIYGGRRPIWGMNSNRTMSHYPLKGYEPEHPRHKGFIFNCYGSGLDPDEYWLASTAGRRSTAESSIGGIAKSGHLEYKVKRAVEDVVVSKGNNSVDVRTNTIVSFNLGGDGLRPFHIRGTGHTVNGLDTLSEDGRVLTLQPLLFEFHCKHDETLMDECMDCVKSLNVDYIFENIAYAHATATGLVGCIEGREILKPQATKLIEKFNWWFAESQCEVGEAIGATAAACLGEPVTQAGLRSFHAGGKFSNQGSVEGIERVVQIAASGNPAAETIIFLKEEFDMKDAEAVARFCTRSYLGDFITSVEYKDDTTISIILDPEHIERQELNRGFAQRQITRALPDLIIEQGIIDNNVLIMRMDNPNPRRLLLVRDILHRIQVSGLSDILFALPEEPKETGLGAGLCRVRIRGPTHSGNSAVLWGEVHELLKDYIVPELSWTSEYWVIYKELGLEAMLSCLYEQIDIQMNGDNGLGEYDHRYIQTLVDRIGQKGFPVPLQANSGWGGKHNSSFLGAIAGEGIVPKIAAGAMLNNIDKVRGMVEAVTTGNTARVGPDVLQDER